MKRIDLVYTLKRVKCFSFKQLFQVSNILNACGKDMAEKYNLHHWDNHYIKTLVIVCLCVIRNEVYLICGANNPVATFQIKGKEETLKFQKLGTLPALAGNGIGSYCLHKIEEIASERGYKKVAMEVYKPSQHAISFYEHKGYVVVGETNTLKYKELKMEKNI